jgi:hypothetical protein
MPTRRQMAGLSWAGVRGNFGLGLAIISQALKDVVSNDAKLRADAEDFFNSPSYYQWADLLNLDPEINPLDVWRSE